MNKNSKESNLLKSISNIIIFVFYVFFANILISKLVKNYGFNFYVSESLLFAITISLFWRFRHHPDLR